MAKQVIRALDENEACRGSTANAIRTMYAEHEAELSNHKKLYKAAKRRTELRLRVPKFDNVEN